MKFQFDPLLRLCPLCNSTDIKEYHRDYKDIVIFRCGTCDIQFMNPQYSDHYLAEYYSQYTVDEPQWDEPLYYCHEYYLTLIEKYLPQKGILVDVGSGKGHCVTVAKKRGWKPVGYEIDVELAKKMSEKLSIEIKSGNFIELQWERESFDAVYVHHVLEHLKNPLLYLSVIGKMLRNYGILFIVIPNIKSRSAFLKFYLEKLRMRKNNVGSYYDTSHHVFYFSPKTLQTLLERFGFKILYKQSGHPARPNQSKIKRWWLRNFSDKLMWKSTFLLIAQKQ